MIGALRFPAYGITQKLAELRHLGRFRSSAEPHAVIDFDQITPATGWARVALSGALGLSPYASFFVWLLFRYDYRARRRRGGAEWSLQYLNVWKWASLSTSVRNWSDNYGGDATSLTARRERIIASKTHGERSIFSKRSLFGRCHRENGH